MRVSGKVAIVTGAYSGIGYACAQILAQQGAVVYAADKSKTVPQFSSPNIKPLHLDVARESDWDELVATIHRDAARLDILVNNAGIGFFEGIHDTTLSAWNEVIAVDQTGVMLGMQRCLPMLRARHGSIINISSIFGLVAVPALAAYHAAKGAVIAMTRNAAVTYASWGVRVNVVHPGVIDTPLLRTRTPAEIQSTLDDTPLSVLGTPDDIAMGVLYLASDESKFVTGASLVIDGGYTAR